MIGCGLVQNFSAIFLPEWLSNLEVTLLTSYSFIYRLIFRYYTELSTVSTIDAKIISLYLF